MLIYRCISLVLLFFLFGCGVKYTQEQLDAAVEEATRDMYTQEQLDAAVKEATRDMYTQEQLDAAVKEATRNMYTQEQLDKAVEEATRNMYTQEQLDKAVEEATRNMYTQEQLDKAVEEATRNMYTQEQLDKAVEEATKEMISKADYNLVKDQLIAAQVKAATSKAEQAIELTKQINFFGFDEEAGTVPKEVVPHLNEAKQELDQAEKKLDTSKSNPRYHYLAKESAMHATKAFKLRTEIVYYSLIRYHYRLGGKYKQRGEREEKQESYQEAYKIAKQLFENATRIDSQSPLFNDTAYYLAEMALDFYGDRRLTTAEEVYKLIKKYRWREGRVQKLISDLRGKVGD